MALENARLYETARNLADRDPLTGFFNHRYLHERLAEEVVRAVRTHRPLSVVMLDLDDFKLVNDSFGHLYGDGVLVHVAELIRSSLRASDVAGALRRRRVRADPARDRPPRTPAGSPRGCSPRSASRRSRPTAGVPFPIGGVDRASRPTRATAGPPRSCSRSPTAACTTPRPPAATGSGAGLDARRPPIELGGRTAAGPASRSRGRRDRRAAGRLRCGRVGPEPVRKYQDPGTDSTGAPPLPRGGDRPHARSQVSLRNRASGDLGLRIGTAWT